VDLEKPAESGKYWSQHHGNNTYQLDHNVQSRSRGILHGITNGITNDSRFMSS